VLTSSAGTYPWRTAPLPRTSRPLSALLSLLLAAACLVVSASVAIPTARADTVEDLFATMLNGERTAQGLAPLTSRDDLVAVARSWAGTMASAASLYHNPDLTTLVADWVAVGENVGYGPDPLSVHVAFMSSPGHRANILDTDYTEVGVGAVVLDGRVWVAEVFRQPAPSPSPVADPAVAPDLGTSTDLTVTPDPVSSLAATASPGPTTGHETRQAAFPGTLRHGSKGPAVRKVQARLRIRTTGFYGNRTERTIRRFQRSHGLRATGVVGQRTWNRLF